MIRISDVTFSYKNSQKKALDGISLHVPAGRFLGVIGASSAGKTTLIRAVNGTIPHHHQGDFYGSILVDGHDTFDTALTDLSCIAGTVFQDIDSMMVSSCVEDELLYGLENFGVARGQIEDRIRDALEAVGISQLRDRQIDALSGGQKQKVAIAAILALRPKLLLLDEPTGELDPQSSRQIFSILQRLCREEGITVVVVEQKIMLLSEFADDLAVLDQGRLAFHGPVRQVLAHSDELEAIGVHCPRMVSLSKALEREQIDLGGICVTVDEAAEKIGGLLK